jgi:predicted class III extradiol MEMO1 family dioxygenase
VGITSHTNNAFQRKSIEQIHRTTDFNAYNHSCKLKLDFVKNRNPAETNGVPCMVAMEETTTELRVKPFPKILAL